MQRPKTYWIREIAYQELLQRGPMSLTDLAGVVGIPKEELRYAIESTMPFGAVFRKTEDNDESLYEAVAIDEVYGGDGFY